MDRFGTTMGPSETKAPRSLLLIGRGEEWKRGMIWGLGNMLHNLTVLDPGLWRPFQICHL